MKLKELTKSRHLLWFQIEKSLQFPWFMQKYGDSLDNTLPEWIYRIMFFSQDKGEGWKEQKKVLNQIHKKVCVILVNILHKYKALTLSPLKPVFMCWMP